MEFAVLGWPDDRPVLELPHERFAYAGKFVVSGTGKAVGREGGEVVAAASFDRDRAHEGGWRVRYVTVRDDRRGEGIGARLLAFVGDRLVDVGADRVRIAVNNAFAYEAAYKAGFGFTGEETGLAELVLQRPVDRSVRRYREGMSRLADRDGCSAAGRDFAAARRRADPPGRVRERRPNSGSDRSP